MIAGFNDPDEGDILFGTESILHLPAHKRDTGMVFQNYALFPHMTVAENVAYGLRARGGKKLDIQGKIQLVTGLIDPSFKKLAFNVGDNGYVDSGF